MGVKQGDLGSGPAVVHFVGSSAIPFPEISVPNATRLSKRKSKESEWQHCGLSALYVTNGSPEIYWKTNLGKDPEPIILSTEQTTLYALPSRYALGHLPKATLCSRPFEVA